MDDASGVRLGERIGHLYGIAQGFGERQTLAAGLEQGGFDSGSPAFFSWLGVTPYLTRESCMATLRFIAQLPPGSGVVFDFAVDPKLLNLPDFAV